MNKVFFISLVMYMVALGINAQNSSKFTGAILWKVSGKDIAKPSYILGTDHLADIAFLDEVSGFKEAFAASNVVVGELDLSDKEKLLLSIEQAAMMDPSDKGYTDLLSKDEFADLNTKLINALGLPLSAVIGVKPLLLTVMLTAKIQTSVNPAYNPETHVAIDEYVQSEGMAAGKKIIGLETAEYQIDALFSDVIEDQLADLICTLNELELGMSLTGLLNEYYDDRNLEGLYELSFGDHPLSKRSACPMSKEKKRSILDNRNNKWLEGLPKLLKDDSNFIAVGALHLAGEEGLLFQLDKMGYTVAAVK